MTRMRDELANNLAKRSDVDDRKSEVEKHLARERRKLTETDDTEIQQDIRDRMEKLKGELSDIELERHARLEALSTNKAALLSQINRIRETFTRLLHEDKALAERIRTLFRKQGITIRASLQQSAWRSRHSCLRSLAEERGAPHRRLPSHPTRAGSRSG